MTEGAVIRALYGKLAGDTTLTTMLGAAPAGFSQKVFHRKAPTEATFPYVIVQQQSGVHSSAFGTTGGIALEDELWLVKAVDENLTTATAERVAGRVETLLGDATLSIAGGEVVYCRKENAMPGFTEEHEGRLYQHAGSVYRVVYQPA